MLPRATPQPPSRAWPFTPLRVVVFVALSYFQVADAQDLTAARDLLRSNQAQAAYDQLRPQAEDLVDDVEFSFLYGYSALLSQHYQDALVAFDRVLSINPSHAGARIQSARALYTLGAYDLAKTECKRALELDLTESLKGNILQLLEQIDATQAKQKQFTSGYLEYQIGHDSNVSSAINSIDAYQSALLNTYPIFRDLGMEAAPPTGNSVLQSAPFFGLNAGLQWAFRYQPDQSFYASADAQRRNYYAGAQAFDATSLSLSGGSVWEQADTSLRLSANLIQFFQEGESTTDPKTTNNKQSWGLLAEFRPTLSGTILPAISATYSKTEVPNFRAQETEQQQLGASVLWKNLNNDRQLLMVSYQYAKDLAVAPLDTYNPSKVTQGYRVFGQTNGPQRIDLFFGLGWTLRDDSASYGRGQQNVEFGKDSLIDWAMGAQARLGTDWSIKGQLMGSQNNSNIPLFEFQRREISVFLRREFR